MAGTAGLLMGYDSAAIMSHRPPSDDALEWVCCGILGSCTLSKCATISPKALEDHAPITQNFPSGAIMLRNRCWPTTFYPIAAEHLSLHYWSRTPTFCAYNYCSRTFVLGIAYKGTEFSTALNKEGKYFWWWGSEFMCDASLDWSEGFILYSHKSHCLIRWASWRSQCTLWRKHKRKLERSSRRWSGIASPVTIERVRSSFRGRISTTPEPDLFKLSSLLNGMCCEWRCTPLSSFVSVFFRLFTVLGVFFRLCVRNYVHQGEVD